MSQLESLTGHFALSPSITNPLRFAGTVGGWFETLVYSEIDTPEKRAAIVHQVMDAYDAITAAIAKNRPFVAMAFGGARKPIETLLTNELETLAHSLSPVPPTVL